MCSAPNQDPAETLRLLVKLQDLDLLIREVTDVQRIQQERDIGFKIEDVSKLQEARNNLAGSIDPMLLRQYERLLEHNDRAVAPVYRGACLGCFMTLPTALGQSVKRHEGVKVCENCGRFLYWLGE